MLTRLRLSRIGRAGLSKKKRSRRAVGRTVGREAIPSTVETKMVSPAVANDVARGKTDAGLNGGRTAVLHGARVVW